MPDYTRIGAQHTPRASPSSYSPDLNPIERVWKLTRRLATHNRYFPKLEDIADAVEEVFTQWHPGNETLRRLCAIYEDAMYNSPFRSAPKRS